MQIPMFYIAGYLYANPLARLSSDLPLLTLMASSGGLAAIELPGLTLSAEAHQNPIAEVAVNLPKLTVIATGYSDLTATASCLLPVISVSAAASQYELSILNRYLPLLSLEANAIMGDSLSLNISLPKLKLDASAYWLVPGILDTILPELKLSAFARVVYSALSFNIKNQAMTSYPVFDFNNMMTFNGKPIAIGRTGIYELSGSTDDSVDIAWKIRSGKLDLKKNHLRQIWVTGKEEGTVTLAIEDQDGTRYEYPETVLYANETELRFKIGKGIKTRYFIMELAGVGTAIIDQIRIWGIPGERKR